MLRAEELYTLNFKPKKNPARRGIVFFKGFNVLYFPDLFGSELVLDVFIEEGTCRAFAFDIELENFPEAGWYIVIPVYVPAAEFYFQRFFLFQVIHFMDRG